jgi:exosortase/archaeosortase family protein
MQSTSFDKITFIKFLIKLFGWYFIFYAVIFLYQGIVFSNKALLFPEISSLVTLIREVDLHGKYAQTILSPAVWLLDFSGFQTMHEGMVIGIQGYRGVNMHFACLGLNVIGAFISLMIAFPDKVKKVKKILFTGLIILLIHVLNIIRVVLLAIQDYFKFDLYFDHHDLFNTILYIIILFLFFQWISFSTRSNSTSLKSSNPSL